MTTRSMQAVGKKGGRIYDSHFDTKTGNLIRQVIMPKRRWDGDVPRSPSPELCDISITDKCGFGCPYCYQDSHPEFDHAPKDLVKQILSGFDHVPYQVALGGGEPTLHPDLPEILYTAREIGTIPNYTTAGRKLREDVVEATNAVCGGVAMTYHAFKGADWFESHYAALKKAMRCQVNVHLLVDANVGVTLPQLIEMQKRVGKINVVLLAYYPNVGRGRMIDLITRQTYQKVFPEKLREAAKSGMGLAFSEGLLAYFLSRPELPINTDFAMKCEGLFSCYFDAKGRIYTSSFGEEGVERFANWSSDDDDKARNRELNELIPEGGKPTVWTHRSQDMWQALGNELYSGWPGGEACYECPHQAACSTPSTYHYMLCAYASHNKLPLEGDNAKTP